MNAEAIAPDFKVIDLFRRRKLCDFNAFEGQNETWRRWAWLPVRLWGMSDEKIYREAKNVWVWWCWVHEIKTINGYVAYWWAQP